MSPGTDPSDLKPSGRRRHLTIQTGGAMVTILCGYLILVDTSAAPKNSGATSVQVLWSPRSHLAPLSRHGVALR